MDLKRLRTLLIISIPVFIAHGVEEYLNYFYQNVDFFVNFSQYIKVSAQTGFLVFQIIWWTILFIIGFLIRQERVSRFLMALVGLVYIYQLEHIIMAIRTGGYYAGLFTSLLFIPIGILFWKELIKVKIN